MLAMSGIFGKFIRYIPLGVIIALVFSLYECFFVLPHHFARWGIGRDSSQSPKKAKREGSLSRLWEAHLIPSYLRTVQVLLRYRYFVILLTAGVFALSIFFATEKMKFILFPNEGVEAFQVKVTAPTGTPLEVTAQRIRPIEEALNQLPDSQLDNFAVKVGLQRSSPDDPRTRRGGEYAQFEVFLTAATGREKSAFDIMESVKERVGQVPGLDKVTFELVKGGPPVGKPVSVGIRSADYAEILKAQKDLRRVIEQIPGASDIQSSYTEGKKEIRVRVNEAEAAAAGLTAQQVGSTVRATFEGIEATSIKELDEEIDIRVQLAENQTRDFSILRSIQVPNNQGQLVPLSRVATFESAQGISVYEHENNERQVRLMAELDTDQTRSTEASERIRKQLPELRQKHPNVSFDIGGENEDTEESLESLKRAFIIAILGIYLIMVLIFGSYMKPFLVISVIPLGFIGVIWAFYLHGKPITFLGLVGVVALSGVIVNNGIVFVDFVNRQREKGEDRFQSILSGARMRIRPIFLTTVTTSAGILPTAYGLGGLDPFVVPIALSLGYGVLFGSFFTTLVFPAAFAVLDDILLFFENLWSRLAMSVPKDPKN